MPSCWRRGRWQRNSTTRSGRAGRRRRRPTGPGRTERRGRRAGGGPQRLQQEAGMNTKPMLLAATALVTACANPNAVRVDVVPVESEPHHRTVLENDYLQVFHVILEPGEASLM